MSSGPDIDDNVEIEPILVEFKTPVLVSKPDNLEYLEASSEVGCVVWVGLTVLLSVLKKEDWSLSTLPPPLPIMLKGSNAYILPAFCRRLSNFSISEEAIFTVDVGDGVIVDEGFLEIVDETAGPIAHKK